MNGTAEQFYQAFQIKDRKKAFTGWLTVLALEVLKRAPTEKELEDAQRKFEQDGLDPMDFCLDVKLSED